MFLVRSSHTSRTGCVEMINFSPLVHLCCLQDISNLILIEERLRLKKVPVYIFSFETVQLIVLTTYWGYSLITIYLFTYIKWFVFMNLIYKLTSGKPLKHLYSNMVKKPPKQKLETCSYVQLYYTFATDMQFLSWPVFPRRIFLSGFTIEKEAFVRCRPF